MTTIIGLRSGGVSYLAADPRICTSDPMPAQVRKIVRRGPWAIGVSGPGATVNLVHDAEGEPGFTPKDLASWLRDILQSAGWKPAEEPGARNYGQWVMVAANSDGIYDVDSTLGYCRIDDDKVWSRGSGMEYARGAVTAFLECGLDPEVAIRAAFSVVASLDAGTDNVVQIVRLRKDRPKQVDCRHEPEYPGQDTVLTSLAVPELTCHPSGDECLLEAPHQIEVCGKWSERLMFRSDDDSAARLLGYDNAAAAVNAGACPRCGWREGHRIGCIYHIERKDGEPVAFA